MKELAQQHSRTHRQHGVAARDHVDKCARQFAFQITGKQQTKMVFYEVGSAF